MVLWDIPCSVFIPSMKDNVMLAHHLGMALVAGAVSTTGTGSYYALFFFGVIEISSIPLTLVDIFHPKRFPQLAKKYAILGTANEVCRPLFAVLFLLLRALYFPIVIFRSLLPDAYAALASAAGAQRA